MMTAGSAATRPIAVASSASAMRGATTGRLVVCVFEIRTQLIITALTRMSADRNIDHGDNSRSEAASAFSDRLPLLLRDVAASGAGAAGAVAGAGVCATGA